MTTAAQSGDRRGSSGAPSGRAEQQRPPAGDAPRDVAPDQVDLIESRSPPDHFGWHGAQI